jgi:hypothetical protein
MPSRINSTTTSPGGLISTGDSDNSLLIQTGDTTAITISNTQTVSLTNPLPVSSGGTGANSNAAAPFAVKGANSDITSLSGLTTALSVAQGGTGANTATAAFNALNPMTTTGDILYEASPTVAARLPIGSSGQVLTVSGGIPAWGTVGTSINTQEFTSSGTWTKPSSGNICAVILIGGGGGGGRASGDGSGLNGGEGGTPVFALFKLSDLTSTVSITIGAAGAASTSNTTPGGNGGFTAFGGYLRSYGGKGGVSYNGNIFYPAEVTDSGSVLGGSAIGGTSFPFKGQSNNNTMSNFSSFTVAAGGGAGGPNGASAGAATSFGTGGMGVTSGTGGAGTGYGAGGGTGVAGGGAATVGYCRVVVW